MHLRCSNTECAATLDLHDRSLACAVCGELLEVVVGPVAANPGRTEAHLASAEMFVRSTRREWRVALSRISSGTAIPKS